jgi:hypothetical protein
MRCTRSKTTEIPWCDPMDESDDWHNFGELTSHGIVYIRTNVRTQYDKKRHEKMIGTNLPSNFTQYFG